MIAGRVRALGALACFLIAPAAMAQPAVEPPLAPPAAVAPPKTMTTTPDAHGFAASGVAVNGSEIRGYLSPKRYTTLSSELAAKVDRVSVREGDRFREGQTLVQFDCAIQRAQLERARAVLAGAQKLNSAHEKLVELKSGGALEAEQSALEVAKASGDARIMQATVSKCVIAAPFAGRVTDQKVRDQQFVQAGQPLLEILDDSLLELEFIVPSRWLAWVKVGAPFKIHIDELDKDYPAKVERIGAKVDPVSQSVKIVGAIEGHFPDLIAGMSGRILLAPPK